jgi:hypothetical protein
MKTNRIRSLNTALVFGFAFFLVAHAHADSSTVWDAIGKFAPVKSPEKIKSLKPGEMVVKVCNACKQVTLIHVVSVGQGHYDLQSQKCEYCGSSDTYLAVPAVEKAK